MILIIIIILIYKRLPRLPLENFPMTLGEKVVHVTAYTDRQGGMTLCGLTFSWKGEWTYRGVQTIRECDCMMCLSHDEAMREVRVILKK